MPPSRRAARRRKLQERTHPKGYGGDPFGGFARGIDAVPSRGGIVRRLFSTFAPGLPGVGLLVMRLVGGAAFMARALAGVGSGTPMALAVAALASAAGFCLLAGL